jgi:hypothetical protein
MKKPISGPEENPTQSPSTQGKDVDAFKTVLLERYPYLQI